MIRKKPAYAGVFEGMEFPDYQYQHYPLMMRKGSGKLSETRIVSDAQEEADAVKEGFNPPERVGPPVNLTEKEHKALTDTISTKEAENEELRKALEELRAHLAAQPTTRTVEGGAKVDEPDTAPKQGIPPSTPHPAPLAGANPAPTHPGIALRAPPQPSHPDVPLKPAAK